MQGRIDPASLEPARLDRLIIQTARTLAPPRVPDSPGLDMPQPAAAALRALRSLPHQPREAWVLSRVDELDELRMGQAMDCSRMAARNHLESAQASMAAILGTDLDAAATDLRRFADSLDPGPIMRLHRDARRKRTLRKLGLIAAVIGLMALAGLLAWLRLTSHTAARPGPQPPTTSQSPPPSTAPVKSPAP